ncbi:hypothetical protein HPP92_024748 [Vanilla planifolia]|uniref:Uncharacterized protein n=1 Tax=Vanilla planifolia TaxID=51239 RepID=A0A835U8D4_VANPL|nr:hypothetical protein HPP92_024748 [Vanilla planifolia]
MARRCTRFPSQLFLGTATTAVPTGLVARPAAPCYGISAPIDWLDFCYCHDIGYDTHDQGKLLKADLAFLECLERPQMATKGGAHISLLYRFMCIAGLRYVLIPYRIQLLRLQSGPSFTELIGNWTGKAHIFVKA